MTAEEITRNDDVTAWSDRELLERIYQKMSELDPLVPLIPRALALLDPMRKWRPASAVPKRKATPFPVRSSSEDCGPVGA